jgi:hypothetical protein
MTVKVLQEALQNQTISEQATVAARDAAAAARQETTATVTRLNERVELEVAKAARSGSDQ